MGQARSIWEELRVPSWRRKKNTARAREARRAVMTGLVAKYQSVGETVRLRSGRTCASESWCQGPTVCEKEVASWTVVEGVMSVFGNEGEDGDDDRVDVDGEWCWCCAWRCRGLNLSVAVGW